jgi:hypothetical protein
MFGDHDSRRGHFPGYRATFFGGFVLRPPGFGVAIVGNEQISRRQCSELFPRNQNGLFSVSA